MYFVMYSPELDKAVNIFKLYHTIIKHPNMKMENISKLNGVEVNTD